MPSRLRHVVRRCAVTFILALTFCAALLALSGCSSCSSSQSDASGDGADAKNAETPSRETEEYPLKTNFDQLMEDCEYYIETAKPAEPTRATIGDTVQATDNLSVSVLSVEPGPYDHSDGSSTVKVTVQMNNLSNKVIMVKASNWDADNTDGERVNHKLWVRDANGLISGRSFDPTKISPTSSFEGVLYFDGSELKDVVYEPHWLVSPQNRYIYFDVR